MGFWKWSKTPAANAAIDPPINWAEGQLASTVNDSARAMMAALAAYRDDNGGALAATVATADGNGHATAYAVTTNQGLTSGSVPNGFTLTVSAAATNAAAATLTVDGQAGPIMADGFSVPFGALRKGSRFSVSWDDPWWRLVHPLGAVVGDEKVVFSPSAPSGWLAANGLYIGPTGSVADGFAGPEAFDLFVYLWPRTVLTVTGGRGASALADWTANKALALPDMRGAVWVGRDSMGSFDTGRLISGAFPSGRDTVGTSGGAAQITLGIGQIPAHKHNVSLSAAPDHTHSYTRPQAGAGTVLATGTNAGGTADVTGPAGGHTHPVTEDTVGGGGAHDNIQYSSIRTFCIKL
ncbi:microcystin-dependent protein [Azorhizobium caulinodans ORS 571]|uniref:Microcystin-dependent protein n=1 Tax=Azorhizobium caulinodans (strain ATCC 43989 / DSM 5975 / JCM 20966 / LMG 6465 / NBRC 14845 / NCIMB 13405 / ORS 571) TaxID=438753 RepID=A8HTM6_AZOC5|nr:hypothetical protein [Azorhizobium caulinodans]BAF86851.1 microcystin-dependent protein [Azorhizobium caulinodans ORS 571]